MTDEKKQMLHSGDIIYSGAPVNLTDVPGSGRMFIVINSDELGNITAIPAFLLMCDKEVIEV